MRQSKTFFVLLAICQAVLGAVLSIDYGIEWTKAALVKPGIPLEIVLTKDTKRKEQSVIAFKGQERLYGGDAANFVSTFTNLSDVLGSSGPTSSLQLPQAFIGKVDQ